MRSWPGSGKAEFLPLPMSFVGFPSEAYTRSGESAIPTSWAKNRFTLKKPARFGIDLVQPGSDFKQFSIVRRPIPCGSISVVPVGCVT